MRFNQSDPLFEALKEHSWQREVDFDTDQLTLLRINMTTCFAQEISTELLRASSAAELPEQLLSRWQGALISWTLPDKALYNIGLDIAADISNYVCISPPHIQFSEQQSRNWTTQLVSAIETEQRLRLRELSQGERWPRQMALLVPTYHSSSRNGNNVKGSSPLSPYPDLANCGEQQSNRLRLPWETLMRADSSSTDIQFDAQV